MKYKPCFIGQKIGKWKIIQLAKRNKRSQSQWLCKCDCGTVSIVHEYRLKNGTSKSCGCLSKKLAEQRFTTHGMSNTLTYKTWKRMFQRCNNKNNPGYNDYGGRGVKVCDRWKKFENFLIDMDECPSGMTLDRIDNNEGYYPENCRWATSKQQARNKRTNHYITYGGITKCLSEWSEITGIKQSTIRMRLSSYNYTIEEALGFKERK